MADISLTPSDPFSLPQDPPTSTSESTSETPSSSSSSSSTTDVIPPTTSDTTSSSTSESSTPVTPTPTPTPTPPTSTPTLTTPPPPPPTSSSQSSSTSIFYSTSDGQTITVITVIEGSPPTSTPTGSQLPASGGSGFFHNTGAVAGVFTVVGLIALAILIWLVTAAFRRRRAKKFDLDVAQAAAEAAASSRAHEFDDYDYTSGHGSVGPPYGYSDNSHGTFSQAPLAHEAYGMSEMSSGPTYVEEPYHGAAGVGAGGVSRTKSTHDPYGAFAAPDPALRYTSPGPPDADWADPALAGAGGYGVARQMSQHQQQQQQPQLPVPAPNSLSRNRSQGAHTVLTQSSNSHYSEQQPVPESYAAHYKQGGDDAYGGIHAPAHTADDELPNPFRPHSGVTSEEFSEEHYSPAPALPRHDSDTRMSIRDEEDYAVGRRVLKVANE